VRNTQEVAALKRELQRRNQELEAAAAAFRKLAACESELADERGRNHLLQAEVRELKAMSLDQGSRPSVEKVSGAQARQSAADWGELTIQGSVSCGWPLSQLKAQLEHQTKVNAALRLELEDAKKRRAAEAKASANAPTTSDHARTLLQQLNAAKVRRPADQGARIKQVRCLSVAVAGQCDTAQRSNKPRSWRRARSCCSASWTRRGRRRARPWPSARRSSSRPWTSARPSSKRCAHGLAGLLDADIARQLTVTVVVGGALTALPQAAESERAANERARLAEARAAEAEAQLAALLASACATPQADGPAAAAAEAVRDSLSSAADLNPIDIQDVSFMTTASNDTAINDFNNGKWRRFSTDALASADAAADADIYEAVMDYSTTTTAGHDLHFKAGDRIRVVERGSEGWWYARQLCTRLSETILYC